MENVLTSCIMVWYGNCTAADRKALQRVVKSAQKITACSLPTISDIYTSRYRKKASRIIKNPTYPAHRPFALLSSGKRLLRLLRMAGKKQRHHKKTKQNNRVCKMCKWWPCRLLTLHSESLNAPH